MLPAVVLMPITQQDRPARTATSCDKFHVLNNRDLTVN